MRRVADISRALIFALLLAGAGLAEADELRTYLNASCIVADEPAVVSDADRSKAAPIAGLIVSEAGQAVIAGAVRGLARALAYFSAERDYIYRSSIDIDLYSADYSVDSALYLNADLGCMTLVAGDFAPAGSDCTDAYEPLRLTDDRYTQTALEQARSARDPLNVLRRANVCLESPPALLIENRVVLSEDRTAFRLQGAGRNVRSLLSTDKEGARRGTLLTATLFAPAPDGRGRRLSTHWISYGMQRAGDVIPAYADDAVSTWTPVPKLPESSARNYKRDSIRYQAAASEILSLERTILRESRKIGFLEDEIGSATGIEAESMREEIDRLSARQPVLAAELAAWRAEFRDLPGGRMDYMPVTLQLSWTETRSEKRLLQVLAEILDAHDYVIAEAISGGD